VDPLVRTQRYTLSTTSTRYWLIHKATMAGSVTGSSTEKDKKEDKVIVNIPPPSSLKVAFPDTFDGNRKKLKSFIIQIELWLAFNSKHFVHDVDRILWVVALLRGSASDWISTFLADHMQHRNSEGLCTSGASKATQAIFVNWKGFIKQLNANFGDIDVKRTAMTTLTKLKQSGSAVSYTAVFQQYAHQTNWNDDALCHQYYTGLKDYVKDEMSRSDKPDDLKEMIELAQKIDNRHYERQLEKKGGGNLNWNRKGKRGNYWPQPMELDATFKPSGRPGKPRDPKKEQQLKERLCFNCDKPGHIARDCRQPKKNQGRKYQPKGRQLNATWKGRGGYNEIAVISNNEFDWDVDNEDLEEYESSEEEGELTPAGEKRLREFEEGAKRLLFKEQIPGVLAIMRQSISRTYAQADVPVPAPPKGWKEREWVSQVRAMRCRPDYPKDEEPRGAKYTEKEATEWLRLTLEEYDVQDAIQESIAERNEMQQDVNREERINRRNEIAAAFDDGKYPVPKAPTSWKDTPEKWKSFVRSIYTDDMYPFEREIDNWKGYTDQLFTESILCFGKAIKAERNEPLYRQFESTQLENKNQFDRRYEEQQEEQFQTLCEKARLEEPGYENGNVAEIDHFWHRAIKWEHCYTDECEWHLPEKEKHRTFPHQKIPYYLEDDRVRRNRERRRSIEGWAKLHQEIADAQASKN
jgi:hypothetical protein